MIKNALFLAVSKFFYCSNGIARVEKPILDTLYEFLLVSVRKFMAKVIAISKSKLVYIVVFFFLS